jgi:glycosyltransferase involved in cell wall biosynthesis
MNFLYDLTATQPSAEARFHGGGKYAKQVFIEIAAREASTRIFALHDSSRELDPEIASVAKARGIELVDLHRTSLAQVCREKSIDRVYSALAQLLPGIEELGCETYGTIHGLREIETPPDWHSLRYSTSASDFFWNLAKIALASQLRRNKHRQFATLLKNLRIVTVSHHTRYSILAHFPRLRDVSIPVYYAPDACLPPVADIEGRAPDKPYFLLVSANRWIKNNLRAAIALDGLFSDQPDLDHQVVVTGLADPSLFTRHLRNPSRFVFHDYVDESTLSRLYAQAFALVFMSLNEGFGYPPLEAMRFGTPVIASPLTSIPEVCGDAVDYANPFDLAEIRNRALRLLRDQGFRSELIERGFERHAYIRSIQQRHLREVVDYLLKR